MKFFKKCFKKHLISESKIEINAMDIQKETLVICTLLLLRHSDEEKKIIISTLNEASQSSFKPKSERYGIELIEKALENGIKFDRGESRLKEPVERLIRSYEKAVCDILENQGFEFFEHRTTRKQASAISKYKSDNIKNN